MMDDRPVKSARADFSSMMRAKGFGVSDLEQGGVMVRCHEENRQTSIGIASIVQAHIDGDLSGLCDAVAAELQRTIRSPEAPAPNEDPYRG